MKPADFLVPATVAMMIVLVVGFFVYGGKEILNFDDSDVNELVSLFPALIAIGVSFMVVSRTNSIFLGGGVMITGFAVSFLVTSLDNINLLIPQTGMEATDISKIVITMFIITGLGLMGVETWKKKPF